MIFIIDNEQEKLINLILTLLFLKWKLLKQI